MGKYSKNAATASNIEMSQVAWSRFLSPHRLGSFSQQHSHFICDRVHSLRLYCKFIRTIVHYRYLVHCFLPLCYHQYFDCWINSLYLDDKSILSKLSRFFLFRSRSTYSRCLYTLALPSHFQILSATLGRSSTSTFVNW